MTGGYRLALSDLFLQLFRFRLITFRRSHNILLELRYNDHFAPEIFFGDGQDMRGRILTRKLPLMPEDSRYSAALREIGPWYHECFSSELTGVT